MGLIVSNTDFTGKYELSLTQYNTATIDAYITKYEKKYLLQLLGADLYALFVADLSGGVPVTAIYLDIFNAFDIDINNRIESSNGIKEMLIGFIYYEYVRDRVQNQTPIGSAKPKNENSAVLELTHVVVSRFNDSVVSYKAIQSYICDNSASYTEYNGQPIKYEYSFQ
jgi:hypothetical protein